MNISFSSVLFAWALALLLVSCEKETIQNEFATISGTVYDYYTYMNDGELEAIQDVKVQLMMDDEILMASETGTFSFPNLKAGKNYKVIPEKQEDVLLGISSADIELFKDYLEGGTVLSIGQKVACDMNRDLILNDTDLQILQECIQTPMMAYCLDYRFFHKDCQNLSQRDLINEITFSNLNEDQLHLKIFMLKSGDLGVE